MIISLTGFMGCGKSSVGKVLSELLCCRFVDLDEVIVEREGRSIPKIFEVEGEAGFRRIEKEALGDLLRGCEEMIPGQSLPSQATGPSLYGQRGSTVPESFPHNHSKSSSSTSGEDARMVLALGGGAVMRTECERMVHEETVCVYLRASVETLVERLTGKDSGRPLLSGADSGRSRKPSVMSSEVGTSALRSRILELMKLRAATYERVAHIIVDTDGKSIGEIAEEVINRLSASKSSQKISPIFP